VGLRADLDAAKNRKILPCRESNPGHPASSLSYTDSCVKGSIVYKGDGLRLIIHACYSCEMALKFDLDLSIRYRT
jgi:hypothetical protein